MAACAAAQSPGTAPSTPSPAPDDQTPTLTATTTLVRVPAMVTGKSGEPIFTLKPTDFHLTDDGVAQQITLDDETGSQPLALVVLVETGGEGARHLDTLRRFPTFLDTLVGGVKHRVALVGFDAAPTVVQAFTPDTDVVSQAVTQLEPGDHGAAILDALAFSVDLLRQQPLEYRRAILLVSETVDHGSHVGLQTALRRIGDTNTTIYSVAFRSSSSAAKHEASKMFGGPPGPAHGCMSRTDKDEDLASDTSDNRMVQLYDCLSLLAPPLRLLKVATLIAMDNLRRNVPEAVARQTGGEYTLFSNEKGVEKGLFSISNHLPNQYIISFHPLAPHPGLHTLALELPDYPQLHLAARASYWAETSPNETPATP